jgi:mono/diheme cytochrome c family protein
MALLARAVLSGAPISPPQLIEVTPTVDRLAEPTLPAQPLQADIGSRVYWLSCMPCHGDKGQGLTAEFRGLYPPDHQNCWSSGCHGEHPYNKGFTLPAAIPPLIGPGALAAFQSAADLQGYIASAMPFWDPGSLTEQQSWQVTAFLLRGNGIWGGMRNLDARTASTIQISPANDTSNGYPQSGIASPTASPIPTTPSSAGPKSEGTWPIVVVPLAVMALVLVIWLLNRRTAGPTAR